jgi:hypothetical protein
MTDMTPPSDMLAPQRAGSTAIRRGRLELVPDWSDDKTDEPLIDHRNFYRVKKWSRDGHRVELRP